MASGLAVPFQALFWRYGGQPVAHAQGTRVIGIEPCVAVRDLADTEA